MADRSIIEIALQNASGDARTSKTITFYEEDQTTPLAQTVYNAVSGGSAATLQTNNAGTFRGWINTPQRLYANFSDDSTKVPLYAQPNPEDMVLQRQTGRSLVSLEIGEEGILTSDAPFQVKSTYTAWDGAQLTSTIGGAFGALGDIAITDVHHSRGGNNYYAGGVIGAISIPAAASSLQVNSHGAAIIGYAETAGQAAVGHSGTAIGGFFEARLTADPTRGGAMGLNVLVSDYAHPAGPVGTSGITGAEIDLNIDDLTAATVAWGVDVVGDGASSGSSAAGFSSVNFHPNSVAFQTREFQTNDVKWHYGLKIADGSALFGISMGFQKLSGAAGSIPITFAAYDGATARSGYVLANSAGDLLIRPGSSVFRVQTTSADQEAAGTTNFLVNTSGAQVTGALTASTTITATAGQIRATASSVRSATGFILSESVTGAAIDGVSITNTSNTAGGDHATFLLTTGGASGGDPKAVFTVSGVTAWAFGVDNSDSDAFVFSANSSLGTSNALRMTTAGAVRATGVVHSNQGTATTANGALALSLGASGPDIYVGSGAPTVSAAKGSLYLRTDGSTTNDRAYIATNSSGTWTAITTVA